MPEHDESAHRLQIAIESNEKHRSRARAVATLCAAAAGALSAGLILAPTSALSEIAQIFGLFAIILLILTTGLSLAASTASSYEAGDKKLLNTLHRLEVWRVRAGAVKSSGNAPTSDDLLADAKAIKKRIIKTLSWGLWFASVASAFLIASLVSATFSEDVTHRVTFFLSSAPALNVCPNLGSTLTGKALQTDLSSVTNLLPVSVEAETCGSSGDIIFYLDKDHSQIVGWRE